MGVRHRISIVAVATIVAGSVRSPTAGHEVERRKQIIRQRLDEQEDDMWIKSSMVAAVLIAALATIAWAQDSTKAAQPVAPAQSSAPLHATPAPPAQVPPTQAAPAQAAPTLTAPAQVAAPTPTGQTPEERIQAVKQSLAASKSALKQYEWVETVAMSMGGEEKSRRQSRCYRDATGALQKSPIAPDTAKAEDKKRGLRGRSAEKKKAGADATLKAAVTLMHQYVPVDPAKIDAAKAEGNVSVSVPGDDGRVRVTIKNYHQPGDELALVVDVATNAVKAVTVNTSMAGEKGAKNPVSAQATYGALPDGTLYPAKESLDVSAQSIKIDIENSGYKKQAS